MSKTQKKADIADFLKKFKFNKKNKGLIGVEREYFLISTDGIPVPGTADFLKKINDKKWTYELSACQVEVRTHPEKKLENIRTQLIQNDQKGRAVANKLGMNLCNIEVAPKNMSLDVYPDPHYVKIAKTIPQEKLKAACRVAATHIHIGMPDLETAIKSANHLRNYMDYLCRLGDHSDGKRLQLYKKMAIDWIPMCYKNTTHLFEVAKKQGFADNPRDCYHLIRISIHGTVELRMFGVTENVDEIMNWLAKIQTILKNRH